MLYYIRDFLTYSDHLQHNSRTDRFFSWFSIQNGLRKSGEVYKV